MYKDKIKQNFESINYKINPLKKHDKNFKDLFINETKIYFSVGDKKVYYLH